MRAFVLGNFIQVGCWFIPRLPQASDTLFASKVHFEPGGKGLNVAVGLQRLGVLVDTLVGIGNDAAAQSLLDLCQTEGLHAKHVHAFDESSGWGSGWIGDNGQYAGAVYLGANLRLTPEHAAIARTDIQAAQLVYGQFETSLPAVQAAFDIAHAQGIPTVLNPSPWQTPPLSFYSSTHTLLVNELEAQYLLDLPMVLSAVDQSTLDLAHWQDRITPKLANLWRTWTSLERLVVTLGALGCLGFERHGGVFHVAAPSIHAVDTVGAGDAFACGYCLSVLNDQAFETALRSGNACGAYVASQVGVLQALPHAHQFAQLSLTS